MPTVQQQLCYETIADYLQILKLRSGWRQTKNIKFNESWERFS